MADTEKPVAIGDSQAARITRDSPAPEPDLKTWPPFFILPTRFSTEEIQELEEELKLSGAAVTNNIDEAQLIVTAVQSSRRARFELQTRNLAVESFDPSNHAASGKRKRDPSVARHDSQVQSTKHKGSNLVQVPSDFTNAQDRAISIPRGHLVVLKREWISESLDSGQAMDLAPYIILYAKKIGRDWNLPKAPSRRTSSHKAATDTINVDANEAQRLSSPTDNVTTSTLHRQPFELRRSGGSNVARHLLHETTSEHDEAQSRELPEPPQWVKEHKIYACERSTPVKSPNERFISLLKNIKLVRILNMDEIGVRAYSTSIASIAAYPYPLTDARELLSLPGCEQKIGLLFREFQTTGEIAESKTLENDSALKIINSFYNIWGVGAKTARDFYYERGWHGTDDIIHHGWNSLSRVQQIGLKYFNDFEQKIPRSEVEFIASVVTYHAKQIIDDGITCTIVGGYRRGKLESGDVDIILSHPKENGTLFLIRRLVAALEKSKWITHTLTLAETNSTRGQQPLGLKIDHTRTGGFDTLDKALVVWQDPGWPNKEAALARDPKAKNPNVHRRVDIIISPWRTVGCAITGWSSGTTFQRDLRRFAKQVKGWKFDSSGIRDRATGKWVDIEKYSEEAMRATTPLEAEKRVFEGLGLQWQRPEERCTG